ncbi:MAG TPA: hypothetical protein IAB10_06850 [Candidatus Avilachnospira avistercoris]|nr:hypothetical protein [Candidatus Avilachnospira avistercoris]
MKDLKDYIKDHEATEGYRRQLLSFMKHASDETLLKLRETANAMNAGQQRKYSISQSDYRAYITGRILSMEVPELMKIKETITLFQA